MTVDGDSGKPRSAFVLGPDDLRVALYRPFQDASPAVVITRVDGELVGLFTVDGARTLAETITVLLADD